MGYFDIVALKFVKPIKIYLEAKHISQEHTNVTLVMCVYHFNDVFNNVIRKRERERETVWSTIFTTIVNRRRK